ncbi:MAG: glutamate dehydrogenase, partial [Acidimicrobiia bacterium]|nr:glutamate dehydrogenase [Acidimicrobiia bacterium]
PSDCLEVECDVLIPAALENQIHRDNVGKIDCRVVAEAANGPITPAAEEHLKKRNVLVLPDIFMNAGGVTVSYFEWVQDLQNYFWSENEIVGRLREIMNRSFEDVLAIALREKVNMRTAALIKGITRVAKAKLVRGVYP